MTDSYITVLINDLPTSVVRTDSFTNAISITAWLSGNAATVETSGFKSRKKKRGPVRQQYRCRRSSVREIAVFEGHNLDWQDARLVAVML